MQQEEVKKALERFRKHVVSQAKRNLTNKQKNSSKKLYNSIQGELHVHKNSFTLEFSMEDYGVFQDAGVSGKNKKYNTPYSYKSKMPPPRAFEEWVKRKGLKGRNNKGQFIKTKTLTFLIARSIYKKGIKPSLFFTRPFEAAYKNLPEELVEKYGLDAIQLFNEQIDEILKQNG